MGILISIIVSSSRKSKRKNKGPQAQEDNNDRATNKSPLGATRDESAQQQQQQSFPHLTTSERGPEAQGQRQLKDEHSAPNLSGASVPLV